jgi:phage baseplate assembly protein W
VTHRAAFPYALDSTGQTARTNPADEVEQLLEQILFVTPGERVNRPQFGSTLLNLTFAARTTELTTAIEALLQGTLRKWAGDTIQIREVDVEVQEEQVTVTVHYVDARTQTLRQIRVSN